MALGADAKEAFTDMISRDLRKKIEELSEGSIDLVWFCAHVGAMAQMARCSAGVDLAPVFCAEMEKFFKERALERKSH